MAINNWDDGSSEWMDKRIHQRIRSNDSRPVARNDSYLDKKINTSTNQQGGYIINDPYTKIVVEKYTNARYFGPAHLGGKVMDRESAGNFEINADLDGMSQAIQSRFAQMRSQSGEAISVEDQYSHVPANLRGQVSQIQQSLEKGQSPFPQHSLTRLHEVGNQRTTALMGNSNNNFNQPQQQNSQECRLLEGHPCFVGIQYGSFGGVIPLVRGLGQIGSDLASRQYTFKGIIKAYVVPPQQQAVNMEVLQRNPNMLTELVELICPPMGQVRTIFVPKEAIARGQQSQNPMGYQLLTDGLRRQQNQPQNGPPKTLANQPLGKKMLLG